MPFLFILSKVHLGVPRTVRSFYSPWISHFPWTKEDHHPHLRSLDILDLTNGNI